MVRRVGICLAANLAVLAVFLLLRQSLPLPHAAEKTAAVAMAEQAQTVIGPRITGPEYTLITTSLAPPAAKRLSRHPDFAAVAVQWLRDAGIGGGDRVGVNLSGSFPALNIAVLAAVRAVGAEPVIVSSVGASTWGATDPEFTWLDMERQLNRAGLWSWHSTAASPGGVGDRGGGLQPEGKELVLAAIRRNQTPLLASATLRQAIDSRLELYRGSEGVLPPALINVGGGHVIFGESGHRSPLPEGLNFGYHPLLSAHDGLAAEFLQSNRPVIHFLNIAQIAAQYGIRPDTPPGASGAFYSRQLSGPLRLLAGIWLTGVAAFLWRVRPQKEL